MIAIPLIESQLLYYLSSFFRQSICFLCRLREIIFQRCNIVILLFFIPQG